MTCRFGGRELNVLTVSVTVPGPAPRTDFRPGVTFGVSLDVSFRWKSPTETINVKGLKMPLGTRAQNV